MKNKSLKKAIILRSDLDENCSKKWILKTYQNNKLYSIKEISIDKWLLTINGIPAMYINTNQLVNILSKYTSNVHLKSEFCLNLELEKSSYFNLTNFLAEADQFTLTKKIKGLITAFGCIE